MTFGEQIFLVLEHSLQFFQRYMFCNGGCSLFANFKVKLLKAAEVGVAEPHRCSRRAL